MTGEVGLEGYRTHGLIDVWDLMGHGNGLTFSTLEEQLNKRVFLTNAAVTFIFISSYL